MLRWRQVQGAPSSHGLGIDDIAVQGATIPFANFAALPTGDITNLATWRDGSNNPPTSFSADYQIFTLGRAATVSNSWAISGTLSKLVVASSSLTYASTAVPGNTEVDVNAAALLVIESANNPKIGNQLGTVRFASSGGSIPIAAYNNLQVTGNGKTFLQGTYNIAGTLTLNASIDFAASATPTVLNLSGGLSLADDLVYLSSNYPVITTVGQATQSWTAASGKNLNMSAFNSVKSAGGLNLTGVQQLYVYGATTLNYTGTSLFTSPVLCAFFGTFNADGLGANYNFVDKAQFFNTVLGTGTINIRNNLGGSAGPVCTLGNVFIRTTAGRNVNFSPSGSPFTTTAMQSLTYELITGGVLNLYGNTIRLTKGNFKNENANDFIAEGSSTIQFDGTGQQINSVVTGGETFANVLVTGGEVTAISDVNISRNLTGPLVVPAHTLGLTGSVAQTVLGACSTLHLLSNNTSAAGAALGSGASLVINGALRSTLANSKLDAGAGTLTVATAGYIDELPSSAAILGLTAVTQLPSPSGAVSGNWHFITSPLSGPTLNSFFVNNQAAAATFTPAEPGRSSLYSYSNTYLGQPTEYGWQKFASNAATAVGTGYRVWCRKSTFFGQGSGILSLKGNAFVGNLTLPLAYCANSCAYTLAQGGSADNGWNLVGNPYVSAIAWADVTKTNLSPFYYIYNPSTKTYATYSTSTGGTNGAGPNIAKSQSFFALALGAGAQIAFAEAAKVPQSGAALRQSVAEQNPAIKILAQSSTGQDEFIVSFNAQASSDFYATEDAPKFDNTGLSVGTSATSGQVLAIDTRPLVACAIPLSLRNRGDSLQFTLVENTSGGQVQLLGTTSGQAITLALGVPVPMRAIDSVSLLFQPAILAAKADRNNIARLYPNPSTGKVSIRTPLDGPAALSMYNTQGRKVLVAPVSHGQELKLDMPAGLYKVQIVQGGQVYRSTLVLQ